MAVTKTEIHQGGTGQTTANAAINALLPNKAGNSLRVLRVNSGETDYELASISGSGLTFQEIRRLQLILNN